MIIVALSVDKVHVDQTAWLCAGWSVCTWPEDYCHVDHMEEELRILKAMGESKKLLMVSTQPRMVELMREEGLAPVVVKLSNLQPPLEIPNEKVVC